MIYYTGVLCKGFVKVKQSVKEAKPPVAFYTTWMPWVSYILEDRGVLYFAVMTYSHPALQHFCYTSELVQRNCTNPMAGWNCDFSLSSTAHFRYQLEISTARAQLGRRQWNDF